MEVDIDGFQKRSKSVPNFSGAAGHLLNFRGVDENLFLFGIKQSRDHPITWSLLGWWFQIFFIFTPTWPFRRIFFNWVETTKIRVDIFSLVKSLFWSRRMSTAQDGCRWGDVEWCFVFLNVKGHGFPHLSFEKRSNLKKRWHWRKEG